MDKQLVLASGSPRRKELLSYLGVDFIIRVPEINESVQKGELADQYVQRVASAKASAVDGDVVLGADTCVVLNGTIYGKPVDVEHAKTMLWELSGKVHQVVTGVSVRFGDQLLVAFARTRVEFVSLDERLIDWYVDLGESSDKAGAYALQGAGSGLVKAIDGSPSNVIGLPLVETADLLTEAGMELRSSSGSNRL
ncbi:MAG: Maf family protein [Actinomycetota bacterium]|nr:Maf family protein [Actinomycetota bacterium]MEE3255890.1 Maf family protein [Actinomycetota bacterium]